ncbi:hypothetical protein BDZ97DRAFT_1782509 [Flammula alnicola]|nr:hypothetical protein BDZ97DRAFT_1782509 [Flammula alnicola]
MDASTIDSSDLAGLLAQYAGYTIEDLYSAKRSIDEARYAIAAMLALQIYELIAGMQKEIRLIHRGTLSSIQVLYFLCRYYPLVIWVLVIWAYVADHDADTCSRVAHTVHALLAPCQFFSQAVMMMRAFAFAGRSKRILALLGSCYICLLGVDIWVFCTQIVIPPTELYVLLGGTGCFPNYGDGFMALRIGYSMLAAIMMDLISLVVVVVHCLRSGWNRDVSLARYFVSQGLTAFALVLLINVGTAILFFRPPRYHTGVGIPLILIVSNVVACRVILQLRAQVLPTASELSRRRSCLVRNAFFLPESDSWIIESQALPSTQNYNLS